MYNTWVSNEDGGIVVTVAADKDCEIEVLPLPDDPDTLRFVVRRKPTFQVGKSAMVGGRHVMVRDVKDDGSGSKMLLDADSGLWVRANGA